MRKTTSYSSTFSDALSVDTAGLQKMLNSGRQTASVGYRQIFKNSNSCELPCTENDFYGYKRKALHEFDLLVKTVDL